MIVSAHVAAGALAGMASTAATARRLPSIVLALTLGFLSHALLDAIPHSDYEPLSPAAVLLVALGELAAMAVILTLVLRGRVRPGWQLPLAAGVLGAGLADAKFVVPIFGSPVLTAWVTRFGNALHDHFHTSPPSTPILGLGFELAATALLIGALLAFPRGKKWGQSKGSE